MTILFAVNEENDMFTNPDGTFAMAIDLAAVRQNCIHILKAQRKEMLYNQNEGVDYLNTIFGAYPNIALYIQDCRENLLRVEGVVSVSSFQVFRDGDEAAFEAVIITIYGQEVLKGVL